jgi:hypothetical protein
MRTSVIEGTPTAVRVYLSDDGPGRTWDAAAYVGTSG